MKATHRSRRRWIRPVTLFTGICLFLASFHTLGASYGTSVLDLETRFAFWLVITVLTVGQLLIFFHGPANWLFKRIPFRYLVSAPIAILGATLALAAELSWLKSLPVSPVPPDAYFNAVWCLLPSVGLIGLTLLILRPFKELGLAKDTRYQPAINANRTPQPVSEASSTTAPVTVEKLTSAIQQSNKQPWPTAPPDWVRAQDHYLYLRTNDDNQMIRARMQDLEAHFSPPIGVRVHRSWWIRLGALQRIEKNGRSWKALLQDGTKIPVGRSYHDSLMQCLN